MASSDLDEPGSLVCCLEGNSILCGESRAQECLAIPLVVASCQSAWLGMPGQGNREICKPNASQGMPARTGSALSRENSKPGRACAVMPSPHSACRLIRHACSNGQSPQSRKQRAQACLGRGIGRSANRTPRQACLRQGVPARGEACA